MGGFVGTRQIGSRFWLSLYYHSSCCQQFVIGAMVLPACCSHDFSAFFSRSALYLCLAVSAYQIVHWLDFSHPQDQSVSFSYMMLGFSLYVYSTHVNDWVSGSVQDLVHSCSQIDLWSRLERQHTFMNTTTFEVGDVHLIRGWNQTLCSFILLFVAVPRKNIFTASRIGQQLLLQIH